MRDEWPTTLFISFQVTHQYASDKRKVKRTAYVIISLVTTTCHDIIARVVFRYYWRTVAQYQ